MLDPVRDIGGLNDSGNVSKPDFIAYEEGRAILRVESAAELRTLELDNRQAVCINGTLYIKDTDSVEEDNGTTVIVDDSDNRWISVNGVVEVGRRVRVRAATTANITIATALNNGDTLDGVVLATGNLVLVKDQTDEADNGIFEVGAVPARTALFAAFDDYAGALVTVNEGTANGATVWISAANAGGVLDTDPIEFSRVAVTSDVPGEPGEDGVDGADGATIFVQNAAPSTVNPDGSLWIDADSADLDLYTLTGGAWVDTTKNLKGTPGTNGTDGADGAPGADGNDGAPGADGSDGADGVDGTSPAIRFGYSSTTTDSDPGAGIFRLNHATPASATAGYFDNLDTSGNSVAAWLDTIDDAGKSADRGLLLLYKSDDPSVFYNYRVTGNVVDGTGYRKLTLAYIAGGGLMTGATMCAMFVPRGVDGAPGAGSGDMTAAVYDPQNIADDAFDRANHTGTQTAATISDFDTEVANNTTVAGHATKLAHITVTQAVDLDAIETRVNALDAAVILKGTWAANAGTFPGSGSAQAGESWIVSTGGTVDGQVFTTNDRIIAIVDNASTGTFAANWFKADYTDLVQSVDGATGAVVLSATYAAIGRQVISGAGLTGGGDLSADRTLAVGAGTGIVVNADDVAVDKASNANVRAAASNKVITSDLVEGASALVTGTETAGAVAVDWDSFINMDVTVDENTVISNPTNGQPGTWRTIEVKGNNTTDRTITFGNQFLGTLPTITDCDDTKWYQLAIFCHTTTHFSVTSRKIKG